MQQEQKKTVLSKFPLRLMPSVKRQAEKFSQQEGVSLNQFINVAVAEKLAYMQHDRWLASRPKPDADRTARALAVLDRDAANPPEPGDELPEGYTSVRSSAKYRALAGGKSGQ